MSISFSYLKWSFVFNLDNDKTLFNGLLEAIQYG